MYGRINFLQLERYRRFGEEHYRQQSKRKFDWISFNSSLASLHHGHRIAIAFDPSHISKSGNVLPTLDASGRAVTRQPRKGMEIPGIGIIDMDLRTCFHLEAVQMPPEKMLEQTGWTLTDWHLHVLRVRKEVLPRPAGYVVVDAYFSKLPFVDGAVAMGFHVGSKFNRLLHLLNSPLSVFSSEKREMYVTFGMFLQILQKACRIGCRRIQIVVERFIVQEQSQRVVLPVQFVGQQAYIL